MRYKKVNYGIIVKKIERMLKMYESEMKFGEMMDEIESMIGVVNRVEILRRLEMKSNVRRDLVMKEVIGKDGKVECVGKEVVKVGWKIGRV